MTGRRLGCRRLPGSIRFRLTAWYALLLGVVLAALGVAVLTLTENRLRAEVDERLLRTAVDIDAAIRANGVGLVFHDGRPTLTEIRARLDSFAARGLVVQVVDTADGVIAASPYSPSRPLLPAMPPPNDRRAVAATVRIDGADLRAIRRPFVFDEPDREEVVIGAVLVGERLETLGTTLGSLRQVMLIASVAGLALAIAGGWLLADRALRPVDRVTAMAAAIAAGDGTAASLATRLTVPDTRDEIARLAATFNAMLDRLEASFRAQQRFVADASHELRTPLTAIRGNVEVLARQVTALEMDGGGRTGQNGTERPVGRTAQPGYSPNGDLGAALDDIQRESARMGRLLDDLLFLARDAAAASADYRIRPVHLDEVARDAGRTAAALATGQAVEVTAPGPVTVEGDADRLHQLILILLDNGLRHTPPGGRVTVAVTPVSAETVRLSVTDDGEGIAAEHLPHLFDRFYRADGARGRETGGTGLGLAIARAIARAHGGEITVASRPGDGSRFSVDLPYRMGRAEIPLGPADPY